MRTNVFVVVLVIGIGNSIGYLYLCCFYI